MATTVMLYDSAKTINFSNSPLTNLANSGTRVSDVVSNSSDLYLDALVAGRFVAPTGGAVNANGVARVYVAASVDGGVRFSDSASGNYPFTDGGNKFLLGHINMNVSGKVCDWGPFGVASLFDGYLPEKWTIAIENVTGQPFNAASAHFSVWYGGVKFTTV